MFQTDAGQGIEGEIYEKTFAFLLHLPFLLFLTACQASVPVQDTVSASDNASAILMEETVPADSPSEEPPDTAAAEDYQPEDYLIYNILSSYFLEEDGYGYELVISQDNETELTDGTVFMWIRARISCRNKTENSDLKKGLRSKFMRVIIHDLDADYAKILQTKCTRLIHADGKYAGCQGCFSCWTKHPAECFLRDGLQEICRIAGQADELFIITENCYGTYSPFVKAILDRSIGLSTPLSTYRAGQMHHTLRYGKHDLIKVYVYGNILEQEKHTFELIVKRNAVNYGYKTSQTIFVKSADQIMGIIE